MRVLPYSGLDPTKYDLVDDDKLDLLINHMDQLDKEIPLDSLLHGKLFMLQL